MVALENGRFVVDGKPLYLYSGEIHYFRLRPALWEKHLRAAREAGLNTVSSYIPWIWHEPEQGRFDFGGRTHPQRNLERWLRLVARHGLHFIARVGPVSNAELVHEGLPDWLIAGHPDVFVRGHEITNLPHTTLIAYQSPTFQQFVSRWYEQVLPLVARSAHPRGPVVLVQLCNEIGMVHWLQKAADYSPRTESLYRDFLRRRYGGDLAALNAAHEAHHTGFDDACQPPSGDDRQSLRLLLDWMAFYREYYADYFGWLHARYRDHGGALPVLANIPQFYDFDVRGRGVYAPMTSLMFREFPARVPDVVFGGAYQVRRLDYENFHDIAITTEVVRMITRPGIPSICAELQTGIMRDRPRLYPQDVALNLRLSMAHGLNALNAYMFSGGRNEPGMGAFGPYHEWQAAVSSEGARRAHFESMKTFGRLVRAFGTPISGTRKHADLAVGFYAPYYATEYLSGPTIEAWEWSKHHLFYDGLARLLQLANLNFTLVDLERATAEDLRGHPALVTFALDFMDADTQALLVAYAEGGGRLLLNPDLPVRDLGLAPCTVLADALGLAVRETRRRGLRVVATGRETPAHGQLSVLECARGDVVARTHDGAPCGASVPLGRGHALVLAFGMNHMFDYQVDLLRELLADLGVRPAVETDGELQLCLRRNEASGFMFAANLHDQPRRGRVRLVLPGEKRATTLPARGTLALVSRSCQVLPLNVPIGGGDILRYATAEVLEASSRGGTIRIVLQGAPGAAAEVELVTRASRATVDGRRAAASRVGGRLRLRFALTGGPQRVMVSTTGCRDRRRSD